MPTIVFLLGPMKSGSSSLWKFMIKHPQVCPGVRKEINYIQDSELIKGGREGYKRLFTDSRCIHKSGSIFLDASPQFHLMYRVLAKFRNIFTEAEMSKLKFIVTLREPVAQMYSYYKFFTEITLAEGLPIKKIRTCEERLQTKKYPFYDGGYASQLRIFLNYFRRDQILILSDELLFVDHHKAMNVIQHFLGLNWNNYWYKHPFPFDDHWGTPRFKGKVQCCKTYVPELGCQFRNDTAKRFEVYNQELYRLVNVSNKNKLEPPFKGFRNLAYNEHCINNPRDAFNSKIRNAPIKC